MFLAIPREKKKKSTTGKTFPSYACKVAFVYNHVILSLYESPDVLVPDSHS